MLGPIASSASVRLKKEPADELLGAPQPNPLDPLDFPKQSVSADIRIGDQGRAAGGDAETNHPSWLM